MVTSLPSVVSVIIVFAVCQSKSFATFSILSNVVSTSLPFFTFTDSKLVLTAVSPKSNFKLYSVSSVKPPNVVSVSGIFQENKSFNHTNNVSCAIIALNLTDASPLTLKYPSYA